MRLWFLAVTVCCIWSIGSPAQSASPAAAANQLGETRAQAGDLSSARDCFARAIALQPNFGRAYLNLGMVLLQMNDTVNARKNLDRSVQLLGKTSDGGYALYVRAKISSQENQTAKAAAALQQAVVFAPNLGEAWSDLGQARKQLGEDLGALRAFERAVAIKPQDPVAQYRLGAEYSRQGDLPDATKHLRQAYELNPKDQSTLNALQSALRREGNTAEADRLKQQLSTLLEEQDRANQNSLLAVKLNNEAAGLEKSGDLSAACQKYGEAVRLDPSHVGIRVNYAVALLRLGEWTRGLNELHDASLRDPANSQIKTALNDALAQAPRALIPKWQSPN